MEEKRERGERERKRERERERGTTEISATDDKICL